MPDHNAIQPTAQNDQPMRIAVGARSGGVALLR
jgi:hypothetical protein